MTRGVGGIWREFMVGRVEENAEVAEVQILKLDYVLYALIRRLSTTRYSVYHREGNVGARCVSCVS